MDLKQKLIDLAREATGDPEITVAGDFQPLGMTWKVAAGAATGAAAGSTVDAAGLGAAGFALAGKQAASSGDLPPVVVLAASPTTLYLMTSTNAKGIILAEHLFVIDTLDRAHLSVELKQKATVRTAVITDMSTGHEYRLEGKRALFHHMNDMLDALSADEGDDDGEGGELADPAPAADTDL
jgi:hypothetical protein